MLQYFDPITLDKADITNSSIMYLVKVNDDAANPQLNTYSIKGLSSGLTLVSSDPHTGVKWYWPIDAAVVLANANNESGRLVIFPLNNDHDLTTEALSLSDIQTYLHINPNAIPPVAFSRQAALAIHEIWAGGIVQDIILGATGVRVSQEELESLVNLSQGSLSLDDLRLYEPMNIINLLRPECADIIREGLFSVEELLCLNPDYFVRFLDPSCVTAIREGLLSAQDIISFDEDAQIELIHPACLLALREQKTLVALLKPLSLEDLTRANGLGEYPPILFPDLLLLPEPQRSQFLCRINEVAVLVNNAGMYLSDLIGLDEKKCDRLLSSAWAISTFVNIGIPLDDLIALDEAKYKLITNYPYRGMVIKLVVDNNILFDNLSRLTVDELRLNLDDYSHNGEIEPFLGASPSMRA